MEYEKVMGHVQRDMSLTRRDYKTKSIEYKEVYHVQTDIFLTSCNQSMKYEMI